MKIAIIGKGTVGCVTALTSAHASLGEVDWYFDPDKKPQAVGEGSTLTLPRTLHETLNFSVKDFSKIDATVKTGIYKEDWGTTSKPFLHDFPSPQVAMHFNATKLQDYIEDALKDSVNIIKKNVSSSDIDADYILDCSGRPTSYEDFDESPYIPVNSVFVTQCYWPFPAFNHTLAIARPYGWVFGIPLQNRCSVGYMYNKDINTLEEVKEDIKYIFERFNLTPSKDTNAFSFNNYRRKENFVDNVCYNGNASFFLEPLEATTFGSALNINSVAQGHYNKRFTKEQSESRYQAIMDAGEAIIMLHYSAGSSFKSDFWSYAKERGSKYMEQADDSVLYMLKHSKKPKRLGSYASSFVQPDSQTMHFEALYSAWWEGSFSQNVEGLGLSGVY